MEKSACSDLYSKEIGIMQQLMWRTLRRLRIFKDTRGQDLIEYALMAGFVAVSAAALMPNIASSISTVFSQVGSVLSAAAAS